MVVVVSEEGVAMRAVLYVASGGVARGEMVGSPV